MAPVPPRRKTTVIQVKTISTMKCDTLEEFEHARDSIDENDFEGMVVEFVADPVNKVVTIVATGAVASPF